MAREDSLLKEKERIFQVKNLDTQCFLLKTNKQNHTHKTKPWTKTEHKLFCSGLSCPTPSSSSKELYHFQPTVLKLHYARRTSYSMSWWDSASELILSKRCTGSVGYFLNIHYPCTSQKKLTHQHKHRITLYHVNSKGSPAVQGEVTLPTWTCQTGPHAIRTVLNTLVPRQTQLLLRYGKRKLLGT